MKKILEVILNILRLIFGVDATDIITEDDNTSNTTTEDTTEASTGDIETDDTPVENVDEDLPMVVVEEKISTVKEYQVMLKKIGLYTLSVDGKVGPGTKKAIKQFNTIFFNLKSENYTEDTDKMLKVIYNSYNKNKYMTDDLWTYFKNFKKSEYKCPKYCDGYPHAISLHIVMADQYARNITGKSITISSGVRCKKHNDELDGSSPNSNHMLGCASDKTAQDTSTSKLMSIYKELPFVGYVYAITSRYIHTTVKL